MLGIGRKQQASRRFALSIWALALLILGSVAWAYQLGYRINTTASLPKGLYHTTKQHHTFTRGSIVTLCPGNNTFFQMAYQRGYIQNGECPGNFRPLIKPVAAVAGDLVIINAQGIQVNQHWLSNSTPLAKDSHGRPLKALQAGSYRVKPGEVWLISSYSPKSFDSRYFGPVSEKQIISTAQPVWVGDWP